MWNKLLILLYIFNSFKGGICVYQAVGDEVQPGGVLLPASRRGRYLANMVRRQAVDGTSIKFNKDADRMNADAKKKVDVLSEELLPYIIAEQERRITLYKRVMTALQNGEKGVTIAEIRNKPPVVIKKGLMYRCPSNRSPKEPDGSGLIMCEDNIDPVPIIFESCLSAEDKELFVAENRYFFCNRHKIEGPDLPRNGTSVIGCAPSERTSLNYTSQKCALEDTDDVVVHYRYYPDKSYKYVTELDPDREVCDHWNPCQVGYIFSLPGPDQATPASELWRDYKGDTDEEISREEIVPPIPEDNKNETTFLSGNYITSTRRILIPDGYIFHGVGRYNGAKRLRVSDRKGVLPDLEEYKHIDVIHELFGNYLKVTLKFSPFMPADAATYYVRIQQNAKDFYFIPFLTISLGETRVYTKIIEAMPGQKLNTTVIPYTCNNCILKSIMLRADDFTIKNVDSTKYKVQKAYDDKGAEQNHVEIDFDPLTPRNFGDYFLLIENEDGSEERMRALTIKEPGSDTDNLISVQRISSSLKRGDHFDQTISYMCEGCELTDVVCRGQSALNGGKIVLKSTAKTVNVKFPSFEDDNACVYMGIFKKGGSTYKKLMAVIDDSASAVTVDPPAVIPLPQEGEQFEHTITFKCSGECSVEKVHVNGVPLETMTRRSSQGSIAFYTVLENTITIRITEFTQFFAGVYQGTFLQDGEHFTKTLMEIGSKGGGSAGAGDTTPDANQATEARSEAAPGEATEAGAGDATPDPAGGDSTAEPGAETPAPGAAAESAIKFERVNAGATVGEPFTDESLTYECPDGELALTFKCRGEAVEAGLTNEAADKKIKIDFPAFADTNACVYMGEFKVGETDETKVVAVIENNSPDVAIIAPAAGETVSSKDESKEIKATCAKCTAETTVEVWVNDKKHDDTFTVAEAAPGSGEWTITIPIKSTAGVYQGTYKLSEEEHVTKTLMEVKDE